MESKQQSQLKKITTYLDNKHQQQGIKSEETTRPNQTTTNKSEQQQQRSNNMMEQQQNNATIEPKHAIKIKGVVVTDLGEFLARKRVERAARGSMREKMFTQITVTLSKNFSR